MNSLNNFGKFLKNHVLRAAITHRNYKRVPTPFLLPHRNENIYEKALKECQRASEIMKEIAQLYSKPPRYFIDPYLRRFSCHKGDWCRGYICKDKNDNPCICPPKKKKGDKDDSCKKKGDKKKDDPCKKKDDKKKDDPCKKKEDKKKDDPCKKKDDKKKDDPCKKKDDKKKDDPYKKKDDKKKDDPCKKKEDKKKDDPCKTDDPCKKKEDKKKDDPCKKEDKQKDDPCKKEDKQKDDPCKKFKKDKTKKCESESEAKVIKEPSSRTAVVETCDKSALFAEETTTSTAKDNSSWDIFQEMDLLDTGKFSLAEGFCKGHYANTTYLSYHKYTFHDIDTHLVDSRLPQPSVKPKKKPEDESA